LVGVSQTVSGLLDDHASLERQLVPVRVPRMTLEEQRLIVRKAMAQLRDAGVEIDFAPDAIEALVGAAQGLPWFVHVLGQEALTIAFDNSDAAVTPSHVSIAISNLARNRFAQHFSDVYQMAVRESRQREVVLRLMAAWPDEDIPLSEVYRRAKAVGIVNPSVSKSDLVLVRHGQVIQAPALKGAGVVRFMNAAFKRYVNLRHSLFDGVQEDVERADRLVDGTTS
jgi:hypothetical protein